MPQPPRLADLGLALLALVVGVGAVAAVTEGPQSSVAADRPVTKPRPARSAVVPSPQPVLRKGTVVLAGTAWQHVSQGLEARGWTALVVDQSSASLLADDALAEVQAAPAAFVLEVPPGARTRDRVTAAVEQVRETYPDAVVVVTGPFDTTGTKTEAAAETAATGLDVIYVDPVSEGWLELTPEALSAELDARLTAALP